MNEYRAGDVLAIPYRGTTRYIRVGPIDPHSPEWQLYVQDCDAAGFLLTGRGRYLRRTTLDTRYRLHYRPDTKDQS